VNFLRRLRADAEAFLQRLNQRERVLVTVAGLAVVAFVVFLVSVRVSRGIGAREARIESKTRMLAQVGTLAQGWRAAQAERAELERRLKGARTPLLTFVSQTGAKLGIEVNDLRPTQGGGETQGNVVEESVEVSVAKLDLPKVAQLLEALERGSGSGVVKVRRVQLRTRTDDPAAVDVSLLVATYQLKGQG
jgi:general secretion pathway protein M